MTASRFGVLWICGAAGAGKSVAAWGLFENLATAGLAVAYVDIDQLGMLYPDTKDDPYRYALKSAALDDLIQGYAARGAHTLIVSGVVEPTEGPALTADIRLRMCLLSPEPSVLRERLLGRGWDNASAKEAVRENATLRRAGFVDIIVETGDMSIAETVARLEPFVDDVRPPEPVPAEAGSSHASAEVVVITGPRAVGTSTVGFGLATRSWHAGERVGFVDLQQLGFLSSPAGRIVSDTTLAIRQLATIHQVFAQHGAERLVVSAHLSSGDRPALRAAFPSAPVSIVRLRADAQAFIDHVRARVVGNAARLAGDDLLDADDDYQALVVEEALAEQTILDDLAVDDAELDVSRRIPDEVVTDVEGSLTK